MNLLLKAVIAIIIGVLVAWLLDYFGVFTDAINSLIGLLVALLFFFGYDRRPL